MINKLNQKEWTNEEASIGDINGNITITSANKYMN